MSISNNTGKFKPICARAIVKQTVQPKEHWKQRCSYVPNLKYLYEEER